MESSVHKDHRQRMLRRVLRQGLDQLEPHEALEVLLYFTVARQDTNPLAHRLMDHFGSLAAVLDARAEDLMRVDGVGERTAAYLSMMPKLFNLYRRGRLSQDTLLDSAPLTGAFALELFTGQSREIFYLLCLNSRCRLLQAVRLMEGTVSEAVVQPRLVVEAALRSNAAQVIFTHNHPGGDPHPSQDDVRCTRQVSMVLTALDIPVLDHVIVSDSQWYSFARGGEMAQIRQGVDTRLSEGYTPYRP